MCGWEEYIEMSSFDGQFNTPPQVMVILFDSNWGILWDIFGLNITPKHYKSSLFICQISGLKTFKLEAPVILSLCCVIQHLLEEFKLGRQLHLLIQKGLEFLLIYLSISIRPPWPPSVINIGRWCSKPIAEAKGALEALFLWFILCYIISSTSILYRLLLKNIYQTSTSTYHLLTPTHPLPTKPSPASHRPAKYSPSFSHHLLRTCYPGLRSISRQRFRIYHVAIYCATTLWRLDMQVSISSKPTARIASSRRGYY